MTSLPLTHSIVQVFHLNWSARTIFQVIEDINTEQLKKGYSNGMFNKGGVTIRGASDGGGIEGDRAEYFGELASSLMCDYPNVARIFQRLQDEYRALANGYDEEAHRRKLDA